MIKVGIFGGTGYTGLTLVELLLRHPEVTIHFVTSESYVGKPLAEVYPQLFGKTKLTCTSAADSPVDDVDLLFFALPHGHAMKQVPPILNKGKKIIDLSADYRLKEAALYDTWYHAPHEDPTTLRDAVYGLPELHHNAIREAPLIANPGCYATAAILGLAPFLKHDLIDADSIVIDAKSGVSGAGRSLSLTSHFSEVSENVSAYKVGEHRHTPEIEEQLSFAAGEKVTLSFTPHLIPMPRGIFCTSYARTEVKLDQAALQATLADFYANAPFVTILPYPHLPGTKQTLGTNTCLIAARYDERTERVVILSVLDNLVKGAAGQAIQNMNLLFNFPETAGLELPTLYP